MNRDRNIQNCPIHFLAVSVLHAFLKSMFPYGGMVGGVFLGCYPGSGPKKKIGCGYRVLLSEEALF